MKKTICALIIVVFLVLFSYASASTGDSAFIPELLTMTYNEAIEPVFSALSLDTSTVSAIEEYAKVSYLTQEGDTTVYTNSSQTIFFIFGASGRYSTANNVMFYTSLKDENPVKNLPQHAFSAAVCTLDSSCDFSSFGLWVNDAKDGDTFNAATFNAIYSLKAAECRLSPQRASRAIIPGQRETQ